MFLNPIKYSLVMASLGLPLLAQSTLTLAEATARTIRQNRDVLAAKMAVQTKENDTLAAKTRRWPSLSTTAQIGPLLNRPELTFTQGALGNFPATGPIPANNTEIKIPRQMTGYGISQASLPLSQQWRLGLAVKQASEEVEAARTEEAQVRIAAVAQVRALYFQVVALDAGQRMAKAQLDTAQEVSRLAQEGVDKGTALRADQSRAEARLAQAKADVANIDADLADGAEQLNLLMGEPLGARFTLTTEQREDLIPTQEEARQHALATRPELKEARIRLEQAHLSVRSKRLEQIPDLNLVVSDVTY
jgi:outer membrane protein TolC